MPTSKKVDLSEALNSLAVLRSSLAFLHHSLDGALGRAFLLPEARDSRREQDKSVGQEGRVAVRACIENEGDSGASESVDPWDLVIPVTPVDGALGTRRARAALLKITRRRDQPPGKPDRRPGLLWKPDAGVAAAAADVNAAKLALNDAIARLGLHHEERATAFYGSALQHVLLLQSYRAIQIVDYPIDAISFSWSGASRKVLKVSLDEAMGMLDAKKLFAWKSDWQQRIEATRDRDFAIVRRIAPFPVANLRVDGRWGKRLMAASPVIYTGPSWPELRDLPAYEPKNTPGLRNVSAVRIHPVPLIPEIGLHQYLR